MSSTVEVSAKRYRYTGKERDEETGLDHMGARYYASWLGRWTSADPIGLGRACRRYPGIGGEMIYTRVSIKHLKAVHERTHPGASLERAARRKGANYGE